MWLYKNIAKRDTMAMGTHMFMLLLIGTFLCPDLVSTMNLCYLGSMRNIEQIKNYDWGGMGYATLLHFMIQLSRHSLLSLGGASFVWQVRFGIFGYFGKLFWLCCNGVLNFFFFQVWMYEYFWSWSSNLGGG